MRHDRSADDREQRLPAARPDTHDVRRECQCHIDCTLPSGQFTPVASSLYMQTEQDCTHSTRSAIPTRQHRNRPHRIPEGQHRIPEHNTGSPGKPNTIDPACGSPIHRSRKQHRTEANTVRIREAPHRSRTAQHYRTSLLANTHNYRTPRSQHRIPEPSTGPGSQPGSLQTQHRTPEARPTVRTALPGSSTGSRTQRCILWSRTQVPLEEANTGPVFSECKPHTPRKPTQHPGSPTQRSRKAQDFPEANTGSRKPTQDPGSQHRIPEANTGFPVSQHTFDPGNANTRIPEAKHRTPPLEANLRDHQSQHSDPEANTATPRSKQDPGSQHRIPEANTGSRKPSRESPKFNNRDPEADHTPGDRIANTGSGKANTRIPEAILPLTQHKDSNKTPKGTQDAGSATLARKPTTGPGKPKQGSRPTRKGPGSQPGSRTHQDLGSQHSDRSNTDPGMVSHTAGPPGANRQDPGEANTGSRKPTQDPESQHRTPEANTGSRKPTQDPGSQNTADSSKRQRHRTPASTTRDFFRKPTQDPGKPTQDPGRNTRTPEAKHRTPEI
ncbi:hypothetical protein C7M84_000984 [Penaeus vannamei]|uniref:Uncharacterized protein n=1 Tax=Penaeus vannamei TaxID=6689 RepID=A0A3R7PAP2_PENVA|nr:hypothetical protein C7M84_000984 [Penaeus vannamei]